MTTPSIATTGAAFVAAIEEAGKQPLSPSEHLDLMDEVLEVITLAHQRHDELWFRWRKRQTDAASSAVEKQSEGKL